MFQSPMVMLLLHPNSKSGIPFPNTSKSASGFCPWSPPVINWPSRLMSTRSWVPPETVPANRGPQMSPIGSPTRTLIKLVEFCPGAPRLARVVKPSKIYSVNLDWVFDNTIPVVYEVSSLLRTS